MAGTEGAQANPTGGFDLLRRATQAMMSRTAANEDDNADHIGTDTPGSGVATPQPDLQDKRLPGIMSYFGQSGQSTPTRALSTAQPSQSEGTHSSGRNSHDDGTASGTQTPRGSSGAQVPASKGKITIKIAEARNLRKCRDPYVVAVFQRSELISGGPRPGENEEPLNAATSGVGGIPIQRQGSDSGRPAMAIPMRSRQSSNTSISDYNTFRNRPRRQSFTNPTWDAEAVFDVVGSEMLVDISVYDHTTNGEEFLGHVDFEAKKDSDGAVRGWFQLRGHADTMAENAPTGEIYVEALYQRSEKRQFGPSDFEILKLIGKGTFGQVYQVRKRDTQRIYAMKVLQKKVIVQKKEVAHTVGERNILVRTATSDSPFIVGLKFSFQTPSELYLVTDYMSGGELFWHLQKEGRFDERRAKFYIAELILAIQHLHQNDIVYRDLKPENILLDANGHIALCDFGLSKANLTKNDTTNTFCGTTEYLAPEVLLDESGYTKTLRDALNQDRDGAIAAVVMNEGIANICLITEYQTLIKSRVQSTLSSKASASSKDDKGMRRFFDKTLATMLRAIDFSQPRPLLLASPGHVANNFRQHVLEEGARLADKKLLALARNAVVTHASSGNVYSLNEILKNKEVLGLMKERKSVSETKFLDELGERLRKDDGRAWYGIRPVDKAVMEGAVGRGGGVLLVNNDLFRSQDIATRKRYVAMVDKVKEDGGEARVLSSDHESGQRLGSLGGIAAILTYPMYDLDESDDEGGDGGAENGDMII